MNLVAIQHFTARDHSEIHFISTELKLTTRSFIYMNAYICDWTELGFTNLKGSYRRPITPSREYPPTETPKYS